MIDATLPFGGVLDERIRLSDEEWAIIGTLLLPETGRGCRPPQNNRLYFEGMMWIVRTGSQWHRLPDDYGKWNSLFRRYRRWVTTGRGFEKATRFEVFCVIPFLRFWWREWRYEAGRFL